MLFGQEDQKATTGILICFLPQNKIKMVKGKEGRRKENMEVDIKFRRKQVTETII
jgi:hypothetical protein